MKKKEIRVYPPAYSFDITCDDCTHKNECPSVGYVCGAFIPDELSMGKKITPKLLNNIYCSIKEALDASESESGEIA